MHALINMGIKQQMNSYIGIVVGDEQKQFHAFELRNDNHLTLMRVSLHLLITMVLLSLLLDYAWLSIAISYGTAQMQLHTCEGNTCVRE